MNSQSQIEAAVCTEISRFEHEHLGRGPKTIQCYLVRDVLVVRMQGTLSAAEQQLVRALSAQAGHDLLRQLRAQLIDTSRPLIEAMIERSTGIPVVGLHHSMDTITNEEVFTIFLAQAPAIGEASPA